MVLARRTFGGTLLVTAILYSACAANHRVLKSGAPTVTATTSTQPIIQSSAIADCIFGFENPPGRTDTCIPRASNDLLKEFSAIAVLSVAGIKPPFNTK